MSGCVCEELGTRRRLAISVCFLVDPHRISKSSERAAQLDVGIIILCIMETRLGVSKRGRSFRKGEDKAVNDGSLFDILC